MCRLLSFSITQFNVESLRQLPMIFAKLNGGLGNQLFQYAAAKRLAIHHGTSVKLDISYLMSDEQRITQRKYALAPFEIKASLASNLEIAEISGRRKNLWQSIVVRSRQFLGLSDYKPRPLREPYFHFYPEILNAPDNVYLVGFWQSEKYFKDIEETLREELTLKSPLFGRDAEIAGKIRCENSVFVHIRRGDYLSVPEVNALNGVCGLKYYEQSMNQLAKTIGDPHLFVFSDDPVWVRQNLKSPYPMTFVDHNGPADAHQDLRLMSICRHAIIANSTFSWWAAWLINNPQKIIYAPNRWFAGGQHDTSDLLPPEWFKV